MFEIKCTKCNSVAEFRNGVNDESKIKIAGQVEVLFDAEVYIECSCSNEVTIEKD